MTARLKFFAVYLLYWLGCFVVLRAVFLTASGQLQTLPAATLLGSFAHGLRLDLAAAAYLCLIPFLLISLAALPWAGRWARRLVLPYTAAAAAALSLLAAADLGIFRAWGHRIEASVLPYLAHPVELWISAASEPRGLLLALWLALAALAILLAWRALGPRLEVLQGLPASGAVPLALCTALLLIPARGGLQLIPINQSSAYFSPLRLANQAALNVAWNFFDSWRRGAGRRSNPYAVLPLDSARALRRQARGYPTPPERSAGPSLLTTARPNILLIVWESLPARAVERLGGLAGVTPEFAALSRAGLLFRRFYAAGDRTEKGLAALLAGAPTIPDASILRVASKAASLPMLSRDLAAAGYQTAFYYGGELGFGNLKSFAVEGRFDRVFGKHAFPRASWSSKWGAHDDAVAERLLADLEGMRAPFFVTWLTLSSHEPFDVPGPIRVPGPGAEQRFLNSLAYTDHVVGALLRRAAAEPWWRNTLVVIVADHGKPLERTAARVPYKSAESWYHIPMLWTGGALARGGEVAAIGSQSDFPPTLLGQLHLPGGAQYAFGRDLFVPSQTPFAFYGFEGGFGLVTERGELVWERRADRVTSSQGAVGAMDLALGRALLQLAFQDYLDR
jgi:phosphoglycerol transferase MdoB-like AlkP superfamily enzyme